MKHRIFYLEQFHIMLCSVCTLTYNVLSHFLKCDFIAHTHKFKLLLSLNLTVKSHFYHHFFYYFAFRLIRRFVIRRRQIIPVHRIEACGSLLKALEKVIGIE